MFVELRTSVKLLSCEPSLPALPVYIIKILLVEEVGVIERLKDASVKVVLLVAVSEDLFVDTTCSTDPAGIDAAAIPLDDVAKVPAKVAFCAVLSVSAVVPLLVCNTNAPDVSAVATSAVLDVVPAEMLDAMMYP